MLDTSKYIRLLFSLLVCSHILSLNAIDSTSFGNYLNFLIACLLPIFFIIDRQRVPECKWVFTYYGIFIIINIFSSYVNRGQTFFQTFIASTVVLDLYFFFVIAHIHPNIETMKKFIVTSIIVVTAAYYVQVIAYPVSIFGTSDAEWVTDAAYAYRNIIVGCQHIITLGAFYFINKFLRGKSFTSVIWALICIAPLFVRSLRIAYLGLVLGMLYLYLFQKGKSPKYIFRAILILVIIAGTFSILYSVNPVVKNSTDMLVEKIQSGEQNIGVEDYSRTITITYHYTDFFKNPIEFIFGTGLPNASSSFGHYVDGLHENLKINKADWGLLGLSWYLGIPAVLCIVFMFYRAIVAKVPNEYNFLRAWFLYGLAFSVTDPETYYMHAMLVEAMALYMIYLLDPEFLKWKRTKRHRLRLTLPQQSNKLRG